MKAKSRMAKGMPVDEKSIRTEPMPTIPDPQIDELLEDPEGFMRRQHELRLQEAREYVAAEMARLDQQYTEQLIWYRVRRFLRNLVSADKQAA